MPERYVTERLAPALRIRRWCEFGSSTLSSLAVRPYRPEAFRAQMVRARLGDIGITHMSSSPAIAESAEGCVGDWVGSGAGALAITYYRSGTPRLTQAGRTLQLAPGDIVIRDLRQRWVQDSHDPFSLMTVKVPVACLEGVMTGLQDCVMRPLRARDARTNLLGSLIENLARLAFEARHPPSEGPVERLLRSALELAFAPDAAPAGNDAPRGLPEVLASYIDDHLHDPELSVAGMAADLGMNLRTVQRMFHNAGTTPRACILARRLDLAAAQLRRADAASRSSITAVALSLGFNDPAYFTRVFHQRYGMTPTQYRRRQQPLS